MTLMELEDRKITGLTDKIFTLFFKVFLIGSMVFFWPGMQAYAPQEMYFQYSVFLLFGLSWFIPKKREINNVFLGILFLYLFMQTLFTSFNDISRYALMNVFLGLLMVKLLAERIDFSFKSVGYLLLGLIFLNYGWIILQYFQKDPLFSSMNPGNMPQVDLVGFMGIRYALGALGAFCVPFVFSIHPIVCVVLVPPLVL